MLLGRRTWPESCVRGAVRAESVVVVAPVLGEDLGFQEGVELFDGEQLIPQAAVGRFDVRVLPLQSGVDVSGAGAGEAAPVPQSVCGELWAVVAADRLRRAPRVVAMRSRVLTVESASIRRSTTMARASRVYSSTTLSSLSSRPSEVWSNW